MKRTSFIKLLHNNGCFKLREGKKHTVYLNPVNRMVSEIPRHREINDLLVKKILKDLGIATDFGPKKK